MPATFEIEVCIEREQDALTAAAAGATRIEINRELHKDGTTPTAAACEWLKRHCDLPVIAMLRPDDQGYVYSAEQKRRMLDNCQLLLAAGVDGVACGALDKEGRIDVAFLSDVAKLCHPRQLVMHRAFDLVGDQRTGLEQLIDLGARRVLTSGGGPNVSVGKSRLRDLVRWSQARIDILPGGGVTVENVRELVEFTGCHQVHGTFRLRPSERIAPDPAAITQVREMMQSIFPKPSQANLCEHAREQ